MTKGKLPNRKCPSHKYGAYYDDYGTCNKCGGYFFYIGKIPAGYRFMAQMYKKDQELVEVVELK